MNKYLIPACCSLFLVACGNNTTAKTPPPEYVFQQIKTDFDFSAWKDSKQAATDRINERFNYFASNACHNFGYGWGYVNTINPGSTDCETHPNGQKMRCRQVDVELECSRIKPGTVGMGMIPFTQ